MRIIGLYTPNLHHVNIYNVPFIFSIDHSGWGPLCCFIAGRLLLMALFGLFVRMQQANRPGTTWYLHYVQWNFLVIPLSLQVSSHSQLLGLSSSLCPYCWLAVHGPILLSQHIVVKSIIMHERERRRSIFPFLRLTVAKKGYKFSVLFSIEEQQQIPICSLPGDVYLGTGTSLSLQCSLPAEISSAFPFHSVKICSSQIA